MFLILRVGKLVFTNKIPFGFWKLYW
jgi:hypothetical protein